jgi:hypothetical protein
MEQPNEIMHPQSIPAIGQLEKSVVSIIDE